MTTSSRTSPSTVVGVVVVGIIVVMGLVKIFTQDIRDNRPEEAAALVRAEAKKIVGNHGKDYQPPKDPWGTTLDWQFQPDIRVHVAVVLSAGPDQEFNTDDDISGRATDVNKTGIVAEYAGSKVGEAVKGFMRGLLHPAKHEQPDDKTRK